MKMKPFALTDVKPFDGDVMYENGKYQVIVKYHGDHGVELSIRREDRKPVMKWRDLQWIKNQLIGPEREAVQLFPAESRLVDTANQYYLYALPEGMQFPFGFRRRMVTERIVVNRSVQEPFEEHVRPADLEEREEEMREELRKLGAKENER